MDLRSMLNEPSSQRQPQTQTQHHHQPQHTQQQQQPQPPAPAQHHRPHPPPPPPPLQPPQAPQQYQQPGYPPRQQHPQQHYPPAQSPHHAPSPANHYPYAPPSPHGGHPVNQHHYPYSHPQGQPTPYGPAPNGGQSHQSHPQYQGLQHQHHHQHQHQQQAQQQSNHHQTNPTVGPPQPPFYPPQSPHQQQFNPHYARQPASPRGSRPPIPQTNPNDRAPQHIISTPTNTTRHPREGDRVERHHERDRSVSPKTRVYPEEYDRDADSIMRDDGPAGYKGNAGQSQGGGSINVQTTRPSHHRSQSQGIPHSAMRGNSHLTQQGPPGSQLQRNMEIDTEHDGRTWSSTAPGTPVDRKGANGFEHGPANHNPHAEREYPHVREISSQAHSHQTQNTPIPNSTNNNAPSAAHPSTLSHPPPKPQHPQQHQQQQHQHQKLLQQPSPLLPQPPPPPPLQSQPLLQSSPPQKLQEQQHIPAVPSNNLQRPVTSSPATKEQLTSPFHPPPPQHRSTPSNSSPFPNRPPQPPQPPSPKTQSQREILPPPAPPSMSGPPRKRPRHEEPPIFARKASRSTSNSPVMPNRRNPPGHPQNDQPPLQFKVDQSQQPQHPQQPQPPQLQQLQQLQQPQQPQPPQPQPQQTQQPQQPSHTLLPQSSPLQPHPGPKVQVTPIKRENTGPPQTIPQSPAMASHYRQPFPNEHPTLGSWEPSIANVTPYEELTRRIADFLFNFIVKNDDPSLDWSGTGGPMLEIEAKLGQIISKRTESRLRLPIHTETVLVDDRDFAFRSTMTEQQHKQFNNYLNERFAECQPKRQPQKPPPPPARSPSPSSLGTSSPSHAHNHHNAPPPLPPSRVPMNYVHTKERDTFYELPPRELQTLPSLVHKLLGKKTPKIRVTTDEKGTVLNKIIKCRVADLNVYSPATAFDWRVSVNLEMPYKGEVDEKGGEIGGGKGDARGNGGERNKDRMSYKCLGGKFTVDLTQVTSSFDTKKEHELEIEMDSITLKKQGTLAMNNKQNGFEEYVRGFVNNVRILVRVVNYAPEFQ